MPEYAENDFISLREKNKLKKIYSTTVPPSSSFSSSSSSSFSFRHYYYIIYYCTGEHLISFVV
jgi:hypothetical protein